MAGVLLAARAALGLCLAAYSAYALLTVRAARRWRSSAQRPDPSAAPPITILKPLAGADPELEANLESFCRVRYPAGRLQMVLGALDAEDPALEIARMVAGRHPEMDVVIAAGGDSSASNRKVANLANMLGSARHDILLLADSDVRVAPDHLLSVSAAFGAAASGMPPLLVTALYRGASALSLPSRLEALGIGADFIPSVLVGRMLGAPYASGVTIALRRTTLELIGGLEAMKDQLADDYRLAASILQAGGRIEICGSVADNVLGSERLGQMWARRLRWARTVRSCQPAGYAASVITHGLALALLFLATDPGPVGLLALAAILALRIGAALLVASSTGDAYVRRLWILLPLSDLVSFALFCCSFAGSTVSWRGQRFRVRSGGRLTPI